jgi:putative membrane protein
MDRVRRLRAVTWIVLGVGLASPLEGQAPPGPGPAGTGDVRVAAPRSDASADPARTPDATFLAKAAEAAALDAELARLGVDRASRADVKAFAVAWRDAAGAIDAGLTDLAKGKHHTIAVAVSQAPARTPATDVAARDAAGFDDAFVAAAMARLDAAVALFDAESRDGRDEEVKDWAARQLPALRTHQGAARGLRPRAGS